MLSYFEISMNNVHIQHTLHTHRYTHTRREKDHAVEFLYNFNFIVEEVLQEKRNIIIEKNKLNFF